MKNYTKTRYNNIYKTSAGTYRVRKMIDGYRYSEHFNTLKSALKWLKNMN